MWYHRPAQKLYHLGWTAIDWLYPPECGGCMKPGFRWCAECQKQTTRIGPLFCPKCGNFNNDGNLCPRCNASPPSYVALRSWGIFIGPLREAIHRLKYQHDIGLGEALSGHLIGSYLENNWHVDLVVPIPLSLKRQVERGYNQAALLAWPFSLGLGLLYRPKAIQRIRDTRSQVGLRAHERLDNVMGAFLADRKQVAGKTILVIDDVTTTGATLSAAALAFMDAGARQVFGLSLARSSYGLETDVIQAA
jgi:competence protein ComFC